LESYRLHAKLYSYRAKADKALKTIQRALKFDPAWYVAWSGGKDSNVLLHLAKRVEPQILAIHVDTPLDYPDCRQDVLYWVRKWQINATLVQPEISPWEIIDRHGGPEGQVNEARSELDRRCFFEPLLKKAKSLGLKGAFLGLRAEESRARRWNRIIKGKIYRVSNGDMLHSTPIVDWTAKDVWAYHIENNLPWLPVYDKTKGHPDPERIREGWFIPGRAAIRHGGLVWLKLNYPELFEELKRRYPQYAAQI